MLEGATSEGKDIVLIGDLNTNLLVPSNLSSKLTPIANEYNLTQLISKPTRITDRSQTLIDVLFHQIQTFSQPQGPLSSQEVTTL